MSPVLEEDHVGGNSEMIGPLTCIHSFLTSSVTTQHTGYMLCMTMVFPDPDLYAVLATAFILEMRGQMSPCNQPSKGTL